MYMSWPTYLEPNPSVWSVSGHLFLLPSAGICESDILLWAVFKVFDTSQLACLASAPESNRSEVIYMVVEPRGLCERR